MKERSELEKLAGQLPPPVLEVRGCASYNITRQNLLQDIEAAEREAKRVAIRAGNDTTAAMRASAAIATAVENLRGRAERLAKQYKDLTGQMGRVRFLLLQEDVSE